MIAHTSDIIVSGRGTVKLLISINSIFFLASRDNATLSRRTTIVTAACL